MKNKALFLGLTLLLVFSFMGCPEQKKEEKTFSDGLTEINVLWEKNNVDSSYLVSNNSSIEFSVSDLEALNTDLINYQESLDDFKQDEEVQALKDFTEIHLLLVDELVLALEVKEVNDGMASEEINGDNLCSFKQDLKFVAENTIELNEKMKKVNDLVYAFNEVHPGLVEEANLTGFIADTTSFSQTELDFEIVLEELERLC